MGIYDKGVEFDPSNLVNSAKKFAPVFGLIIIVLIVSWLVLAILTPQPIVVSFSKNPITPAEQTVLNVTITNTTDLTARDVIVEVYAEDKKSISVAPPIKTISILDKFRKLEFVINPVGEILPGDYLLNITTEINGQKFEKKSTLSIEKRA